MKKILPPVLVAILIAAMSGLHYGLHDAASVPLWIRFLAPVPIGAGLLLLVVARLQFARRQTNIYTFDEPGMLVTDGVFRLSRHPMYLGFALVLVGAAMAFGNSCSFLLALLFIVVADQWYIAFEERWLQRKFGEAYLAYKRSVRRWV
jgi:protein-S-isoprenylcysteine O-methyltransferase Ste14